MKCRGEKARTWEVDAGFGDGSLQKALNPKPQTSQPLFRRMFGGVLIFENYNEGMGCCWTGALQREWQRSQKAVNEAAKVSI